MPTVLNNTNRNFMAFHNAGTPTAPLLQRVQVRPGFSQITDRDLRILKTDDHFVKACDLGLVVINAGAADKTETPQEITPVEAGEISVPVPAEPDILPEPEPEKPKKKRGRKKKKADPDFGDFD